MDYHSMKRSELQKLCKEHKIPANSANSVLADKLSELLNVKQKPKGRQRACIKSPSETIAETESAVSRRQSRKVRFSPEVEYERSGKRQKATEPVVTETRGRRKSVAKKADEPAVDDVNTETDNDVQIPVKVTRSRAHILVKDDVIPTNDRKQGRRGKKEVEKETEAVKETEGNVGKVTRSKAVKETVVATRATRSKGQTVTEDSKDLDSTSQVKETVVATRATRSKNLDSSPQVKKKSGRQMKKDEEKVEPSKEVKDVPVRATRSRVQTSNDDTVVANPPAVKKRTRKDDTVVANPPVEKKRTRKDTMVVDLSENLENKDEGEKLGRGRGKKRSEEKVAEVSEVQDNADKGTRQTRRNKTDVKENESKVEAVNNRKVTRSKASKTVQQLEEPVEEPAGRKNVNRRKSVIQPKIPEVVLPLEEPVNVPAKKDTRRKSVVPKVQVKVSKKPVAVKKEKVKDTKKPQSPKVTPRKTVGKNQSKDASESETKAASSGKKSVAKKEKGSGVKSIETEPVSTKDASENEMNTVGSGFVSQKTRKRRGEPVIEEQIIETETVSTRKNSSAKKEQASAVKTPVSTKRAKLSGIKESDSKGNDSLETPIRKMANLDLDDKVTENEKTPAIDESGRRFTRGAITSNKKEPSQSAIKVQTARKTPGRFARSGVKKQPTESTQESQPVHDAEMVIPEDAEAKSVPDETVTVVSEVPKEGNDKLLEQSVSEKSDTMGTPVSKMENLEHDKVMETEKTPAIDQSGRRFTRGKSAIKAQTTGATRKAATRITRSEMKVENKEKIIESTQKSQPLNDAEVVASEDVEAKSIPDETVAVASEVSKEANDQILEQSGDVSASESVMLPTVDPLSDGSLVQNQEVHEKSDVVSEAEVQVVVNSEESVIPEVSEKETELTKSDPTSEGLENVVGVEEQFVSVEKTIVIEESVEISIEQSDIKGKSKEDIEASQPSEPQVASESIAEDGVNAQIDNAEDFNNDEDEKVSNEKQEDDVADRVDDQVMDSINEGDDVEPNIGDTQELSTGDDDKLQDLDTEEIDFDDEKVDVPESLTTNSEPEKESDVVEVEKEPATVTVTESTTDNSELAKEVESDVVPSTGNVVPILGQSDDEDEGADDVKEHETNTNEQEVKSEQEQLTGGFSSSMEEQHVGSDKAEPIQNADVPVMTKEEPSQHEDVPEVSINTPDEEESKPVVSLAVDEVTSETVDAVEESEMDLMTSIEILENEQKAIGTSGIDQGVESKERESVDLDLRNEQETEVVELATEDDDMADYSNYSVAQENLTIEESSPVEKSKEEATFDGLVPDQLPGDLGAYGSPTTEEEEDSPTDDTVSEPPTSFKNEERPNQDLGNYSFGSDDFQKPVSGNESDDVGDQSMKDDQASSPAVATPSDKFVNWTDSSLKALLKTQTPTQASHVKDREHNTVGFALPDEDDDTEENATPYPESSSLKTLFETPATSKVSHVKDQQQQIIPDEDDDMEDSATPYPDSSMKSLSKTPATTQVRLVKDPDQSIPDEDDDKEGNNATPNPDSSMKLLFKTPATTQVRRVQDPEQIIPDEDDEKEVNNATPYPDSSSLKSIFKTPATSQVTRVEQHTQQQSRVKFSIPNQDVSEVKAPQDPDSSLKGLFKTPTATTRSSHVKEREQSTVRFTLPDEDNTQGNAPTPNPYSSSLKTLFATPATTTQVTHVEQHQHQLEFSLPDEADPENKATQVPDSSLKTLFTTPATAGVSHVTDYEQSKVRFTLPEQSGTAMQVPDSSLKTMFATPASYHTQQPITDMFAHDDNATPYQDSSSSKTPLTTQIRHTKEYQTEVKAQQGPDSSLYAATSAPPIGRVNNNSQQSGVGFSLPHHTFDQDRKQGHNNPSQNPGFVDFEDFSRNYFGDEQVEDENDHKFAKNDETQQDQGSSLKQLFKTPAATSRISDVKEQQQSAVTFGFPEDSETSQNEDDPKNFTFEEFACKYFGDEEEESAAGTSHMKSSEADQGKGQV